MIKPNGRYARPRVLIPVFPGTNCEMDSARAMRLAGAEAEVLVINNITAKGIEESVNAFANRLEDSQILFIPGGFPAETNPRAAQSSLNPSCAMPVRRRRSNGCSTVATA